MGKLSNMPNIGKTLEYKLNDVGINSPEELITIGSKEAFSRIRMIDETACYNMLCALEGAVRSLRWHYLDDSIKKELKLYFESLK